MLKAAVIMGSDSDFPTVKACITSLKKFGIPYEVRVISAHRTPYEAEKFASSAIDEGFGVIIAAAGKAAHLGGVLAAFTTLPVIGIPIKSSTMDGLDSLLSMVQMPSGIPVATVAIDGAASADILATQIIALCEPEVAAKLVAYKKEMAEGVAAKDAKIREEAAAL
ncbi:MAG: 5-(carboxyamino)imidazole ribonucleotide mutase [Clostridia bacterium]|nr:5-(carboxyamino)imidazole ribonucleotide mutase [Clostridia bacterium]